MPWSPHCIGSFVKRVTAALALCGCIGSPSPLAPALRPCDTSEQDA